MAIDNFASAYVEQVSNERDPQRRRAAIERLFHPEVRYLDDDGLVEGRDAFIDRIDHLASMMGPDHRFALLRPAVTVADTVLIRWELAVPGQPAVVSGTDVAVTDGVAVTQLYAITD